MKTRRDPIKSRTIRNFAKNKEGGWQRCENRTLEALTLEQRKKQQLGRHRRRGFCRLYPSYGSVLRGKP